MSNKHPEILFKPYNLAQNQKKTPATLALFDAASSGNVSKVSTRMYNYQDFATDMESRNKLIWVVMSIMALGLTHQRKLPTSQQSSSAGRIRAEKWW